ncbi:hypothetical protein RchiOBHm_Chr7g0178671 [Rosa chinensis]|uniref:Uncharacterized protein n=1 Tax=Rosa chinensis TaxID=74649 RepID=A0A2P6P1V9_ROSCH|nr:hypothetical protein RchiOBHm_Chr7g0178671 [Rosa chinensis]
MDINIVIICCTNLANQPYIYSTSCWYSDGHDEKSREAAVVQRVVGYPW